MIAEEETLEIPEGESRPSPTVEAQPDERVRPLTKTTTKTTTETTTPTTPVSLQDEKQDVVVAGGDEIDALDIEYLQDCGLTRSAAIKAWRGARKYSYSRQDLRDIWDKARLRPEEHRTGWFLKVVCSGDWQPRSVADRPVTVSDSGGIAL